MYTRLAWFSKKTSIYSAGSGWPQDNSNKCTKDVSESLFRVAYWISSAIFIPTLLAYGYYAVKYDLAGLLRRKRLRRKGTVADSQNNMVLSDAQGDSGGSESSGGSEGDEMELVERNVAMSPTESTRNGRFISQDDSQDNAEVVSQGSSASPIPNQYSDSEFPSASSAKKQRSTVFKYGIVLLLGLFMLVYVGLEAGYGSWIFTVVVTGVLDFSKSQGTVIQSLFWGTFAFTRLFSVLLALLNVKPSVMMAGNISGSLIAAAIMVSFPHSANAIWLASAVLGMSYASIYPTTITWMSETIDATGVSTSILVTGGILGDISIPALMGALISKVSPDAIFYMTFVGVIISGSLVILLFSLAYVGRRQALRSSGSKERDGRILEVVKLIDSEESDCEEATRV